MDTKADEKDVDNITEDDHSDTLLESDLEDISKEIKAPKEKKSRKSYTYIRKAEILDQFFKEKAHDNCLSLSVFGEEVGVNKSMLTRWIQITFSKIPHKINFATSRKEEGPLNT